MDPDLAEAFADILDGQRADMREQAAKAAEKQELYILAQEIRDIK